MRFRCLSIATLFALVLALPAGAQPVSTAFTYQGEVDQNGVPATGHVDLRFRLYDASGGGNQLASTLCAVNVPLTAGRFSIALDFGTQFNGQQRFLEIDVRPATGLDCSSSEGFTTLAPRQPLTAAPYAAYALSAGTAASANTAANAAQFNGQPPSFYTNAANLTGTLPSASLSGPYSAALNFTNVNNSFAGNGAGLTSLNASNLSTGTIAAARLPVPLALSASQDGGALLSASNSGSASSSAAISALATATTGGTYGLYAQNSSTSGQGVFGWASANSGTTTGVLGQSASTSGSGLQGLATAGSGATFGVQASSASSSGKGVFGWATSTIGTNYGGHFRSNSGGGTGVYGEAIAATGAAVGVHGQAVSTTGTGVLGAATATSGENYGGKFTAASSDGYALYAQNTATASGTIGAVFYNDAPNGSAAIYVDARPTTGNAGGILAETAAPTGAALSGNASAASGANYGVYGTSESTSGTGVYGLSIANTASTYGVYGLANPGGWSVYAANRFGAGGTKSFRIDHPADPANRYLFHYCTEGPEVTNFYSGKVMLDRDGGATVELPAYFAAINSDPRYTLTAIASAMPMLHIDREIDDRALAAGAAANRGDTIPRCSFTIAGGAPGGKVSWRVEAIRNDRWVRQYGAPVEADKPAAERGTYLHPELYSQPTKSALNYRAPEPGPARVPR